MWRGDWAKMKLINDNTVSSKKYFRVLIPSWARTDCVERPVEDVGDTI